MGDIRVFPGVTCEGEMRKWTLTLVRMDGETQEAYAQRVQQVANLALSFVPKSGPATFDFSDTSKYRKINEHSYELIAPGYQLEDTPKGERDTHFAGWASSLWDELHTLFARAGDKERYEAMDKEIIARAGYDLVFRHALVYLREGADIPDMTAWPEQSE